MPARIRPARTRLTTPFRARSDILLAPSRLGLSGFVPTEIRASDGLNRSLWRAGPGRCAGVHTGVRLRPVPLVRRSGVPSNRGDVWPASGSDSRRRGPHYSESICGGRGRRPDPDCVDRGLPGGGSLRTAQKEPTFVTASTNWLNFSGFTTYELAPSS